MKSANAVHSSMEEGFDNGSLRALHSGEALSVSGGGATGVGNPGKRALLREALSVNMADSFLPPG